MKNILRHTLILKVPSVVFYLLLGLAALGHLAKHQIPVSIAHGVMICSYFYGFYERQERGKSIPLIMIVIFGTIYAFRTVLYIIELVELLLSRL